jgi:Family of unknown function (DUF5641)/Integrase core domain
VKCFRCRPTHVAQPMGDLPPTRVELLHPFIDTGVDYAGPLLLKVNRRTAIKCYVAVFICMATKAVHLELVSDASTQAFLAALTRFISRRGHCRTISSDNGTNFGGARTELESLYEALATQEHQKEVITHCAQQQIDFKFIPPRSPHFGGLWEAAVKSMKYHLKRIAGPVKMTFEEMSTLLTKIEAILNSRPLVPESSDPEDVAALTPGHLLIGRPLVALIEPDLTNINFNRLDRWQMLQQMSQHFWRRWSNEYLTTLQHRATAVEKTKIRVGMLVLLMEDNVPPMQWALARITEVHPGSDDIVRVVTVQTCKTTLKRGVVNVCILPVQDNEDAVPDVPGPSD